MSIANVYVRVLFGNERYKSFAYRTSGTNVQLIYVHSGSRTGSRSLRGEMAPKQECEHVPAKPQRENRKSKSDSPAGSNTDPEDDLNVVGLERHKKKKCCILKGLYIFLSIIIAIISIVVIVLALVSAIVTQSYTTDQSGRVVGTVLIIVTAVITLCLIICGDITLFKNNKKPLRVASIILMVLLIVQAVILGTAVQVTKSDERSLVRSLSDTFYRGKNQDTRLAKMWSGLENELQCCGFNGPRDYASFQQYAPDIPISCCPSYDPNRSALLQEREREKCQRNIEYYDTGCLGPFMTYFKESARVLLGVVGVFIVLELLLVALGLVIFYKEHKKNLSQDSKADI